MTVQLTQNLPPPPEDFSSPFRLQKGRLATSKSLSPLAQGPRGGLQEESLPLPPRLSLEHTGSQGPTSLGASPASLGGSPAQGGLFLRQEAVSHVPSLR